VLRALLKRGVIAFLQQDPAAPKPAQPVMGITLNADQQKAYDGLAAMLESGKAAAALLCGVTGSGKTQVYIKLVKRVLDGGGRALVLVPEIALTPQLLQLFESCFSGRVAMLHSGLTQSQRGAQYARIARGEADVVLGTRSAVFAPLEDLRLIVIDEEQEATYKSENAPRYHARDVAKFRCVQRGALLLLGSATPAVESMYSADTGLYSLFTLPERYNRMDLPRVEIADMRAQLKSGNPSVLSQKLLGELEKNIADRRQSILFINRRGNSRMAACLECGEVPQCARCSVALSYHSDIGRLLCHHCGWSLPYSGRCEACGGELKLVGAGTQKVVQELERLFPGVGILRMDTDAVSARTPHKNLLERFLNEKIPVLVGTQMVAKGLDFENVTLVGVLAADSSLYVDDFRAAERTFSLITQVVGRAGRGNAEGRAVIQTFTPFNPVIERAARQDYAGFYREELELRRARNMPPFSDIVTLTVFGGRETAALAACVRLRDWAADCFSGDASVEVLGPAPAPVLKVNNSYRYRLTLCGKNDRRMRAAVAGFLVRFRADRENKGLNIYADINAY